jgi:hypothetical protein
MSDEIIAGSTFTHHGNITHEPTNNIMKES